MDPASSMENAPGPPGGRQRRGVRFPHGSGRRTQRAAHRLHRPSSSAFTHTTTSRITRTVRRDEADAGASASRCSSLAGASPVSVSPGAPSSRPQARREIAVARAGCQEPLWREPARGPQPNVKPAASTHLQPESRTADLTVKAMSIPLRSGGRCDGSRRGRGRSTRAQRRAEHERPVCAVLVGAARLV